MTTPEDDKNIDVRCVGCAADYTTSLSSFNARMNKCPLCGESKARAHEV